MDAFQRGLSRPIPLEKAAAFFLGLKSWQRPSQEDAALMAAAEKVASSPEHARMAELRARLKVAAAKLAEDTVLTDNKAQLSSPTPAEVPAEADYLENERLGLEAEEQIGLAYYQQQLQAARAETAAANERAQQAEQQVQMLTEQQAQHDGQISAAQQEGQIAQQAAMQQVQSANMAATQAMQQAVDAENRALTAKGQEAAAKIQQQQVRSHLFDLASEGLPGTEPELGGEGNAAEGLSPAEAPEQQAGNPEGAVEGAGGPSQGDQQAAEGGEGPGADGLNEAGEPASAEGMPGQEAAPEGAGAAVGPGAVQPPNDSSGGAGSGSGTGPQAKGDGSDSAPEQDPSAKRTGQVSIKVGSELRTKVAAALPGFMSDPRVMGALAGGALGAGAAGLEAAGHGPNLDKLRGRIAEGEQAAAQPGVRGFARALELAKDRALLTLGEATQNHPVVSTIAGGAIGAKAGAEAGPNIAKLLREAASLQKGA